MLKIELCNPDGGDLPRLKGCKSEEKPVGKIAELADFYLNEGIMP